MSANSRVDPDVDAAIVGAGFSGLYMLHRLRERGLTARVYEKADDVGGTWYWNRYPGARCDSESHIYCYSFSEELLEEWEWSERYPEQPEILSYLQFVADRLDLRRDIEFGTEIAAASFDEGAGLWRIETADGRTATSRFLITAVGCLSEPFVPDFDGLETFDGEVVHTARWPRGDVPLEDAAVGVVGTGSTGIQLIPEIAPETGRLTVFQRTPNYAVPARNRPLTEADRAEIRENYDRIWEDARDSWLGMPFDTERSSPAGLSEEEIEALLEKRWEQGGFRFLHTFNVGNLLVDEELNETVSSFIRERIRERVDDPQLAETLVPTDHPYATKRPPMDYGGYYETFNRQDVHLVDVAESPIEEVTPEGVRTVDSRHDLDVLVLATGFDAMTGALLEIDIRGREGRTLSEAWADGPRTYLGLGVHGFPNLFTITGPLSPSVLSNMPQSIEQHVEWIEGCIAHMDEAEHDLVEPTEEAVEQWVTRTTSLADQMLFSEADSWYRGANVPDKPTVFTPFPGGLDTYRRVCEDVVERDYDGFTFTAVRGTAALT